jgi:hypothetical protein
LSELQVSLPCGCGKAVIARAKNAGDAVNCSCGRSVAVPNLSTLRTLAGGEAYVTNPVDAINKMLRQGINPAGNVCLLCGSTSPVHYRCEAVCESTHLKRSGGAESNDIPHLLAYIFLGRWLGALLSGSGGPRNSEVQGHDVAVTFDMPVCDACAATNGNPTRTAAAKDLMLRVPAYKELLTRYPDLTLSVKRSTT